MPSIWKIITGLVPSRREHEQKDSSAAEKPLVIASEESTEKSAQNGVQEGTDLEGEVPQATDQSEERSSEPPEETANTVTSGDTRIVLADQGAPKLKRTTKAASPKRKDAGKKSKPGVSSDYAFPKSPTNRHEMVGLDDDIRETRKQLASKLELQNTQLRKMLTRFEI
ncbi:hypothetical protein RMR16_024885 (plasmid) [Agrobacterium sp. rho-13.3]|uniref:hypothetical protein n=1 Tax=Agrobacterium sp. rho-13.3 TaxID=3072980 RepID=UPI002A118F78|nr:hypothetical protein [Agrobacterium sp. rho-13.3]MDX8310189.1 hypothetical protein [Agrobacterium sp. rho-13.3]